MRGFTSPIHRDALPAGWPSRPTAARVWARRRSSRGGAKERWSRTPPGLALEILSSFDARFDQLWERASAARRLSADRSSEYLNWRFARCPERTYTAYALVREVNREVLGYLVTRDAA